MKRVTKKVLAARQAFREAAVKYIVSKGAKPSNTGVGILGLPYDFRIQTKCGVLNISVTNDCSATIFTRFDEPGKAKGHVDCNPHSGKWNFHYFDEELLDETALPSFSRQLETVL